ncbi:MAG: tetratricopeptide repeat protein [Planctomycetaceae bacterium]|nr:MAG: tetratricopeptide repeat protein [Planctomycetaceae bacterium]
MATPITRIESTVQPAVPRAPRPVAHARFVARGSHQPGSRRVIGILVAVFLTVATGCHFGASSQNAQGTKLYQQGQYTAAMQEFQKAIATDPQNADGYYNLAATTHRIGVQRQDTALLTQAEALYNQCLDHAPNHVECHRGLAVLLVDTGRPDRAFALLKNWAAQNPNYAEPRIELARLYEEASEIQTAQKYLENAVQIDANNARAWLALGRIRERDGDLVQALQNYQQSLVINPTQPMVSERVAAVNRQISAQQNASLSAGGTRMAQPLTTQPSRY